MPSFRHEAPLELLRDRPDLIAKLVHELFGIEIPAHGAVRIAEADLGKLVPTARTVDMVIELERDGRVVMAFIVECQLAPDPDKPARWPHNVAALHDRLRCPVILVVLAGDEAVAAWAGQPARLGPCLSFTPIVIGPSRMPRIVSVERARELPEMAVLSAITHAGDPDAFEVARLALDAVEALDRNRGSLYCSIILGTVNEATRRALEEYMEANKHRFFSEWEQRHFEKGQADACQKARDFVLSLVKERLGTVPSDLAGRVEACGDISVLLRWTAEVSPCRSEEQIRAVISSAEPQG